MLKGIYGEVMPYNDPHTAAPALWAMRQETQLEYEVSVAPLAGDTAWRKGMEAVAISLQRKQHGKSPTFNFGRMPPEYSKSSGNSTKLVRAGKRRRGGKTGQSDLRHLPGMKPVGPLKGDPHAADWCGHKWSPWLPAAKRQLPISADLGLYRIRDADAQQVLYLGQGRIRTRITSHEKRAAARETKAGKILDSASRLEFSWVVNNTWYDNQRLELENDLIAAYVIELGHAPAAQFLG
jgi:hypothetical protein